MRRRLRKLGFFGLVASLATLAAIWIRPEAARPHVPVPRIENAAGTDGRWFMAQLVPPQTGQTRLPMLVTGRVAAGKKDMLVQEWPGFHAMARFKGEAVSVRFSDGLNRWRVTLNGGAAGQVEVSRPGVTDLRISGLAPGEYTIRVEKISESSMPASFGGIFVDGEDQVLPAPRPLPRLIEFIGDSDTLGFASTANRRDCSEEEVFSATDTSRAFGPQVATRLGADYRIVARSGIGLVRNYEGTTPHSTMPARYPLAIPSEPAAARLPERAADIVVTALGSNDFGSAFAEGEPWQDKEALGQAFAPALIAFLRDRVRENPGAAQILLAFGEYGDELVEAYEAAEVALRQDGVRVALVTLPKLGRRACAWHPSPQDHTMITDWLSGVITGLPH